jgi:hypothetical protein
LLVGIAQNLSDLILDHSSIERQMTPIHMTKGELADIIDRAVEKLRAQGMPYTFSTDARIRLVRMAAGFPWFIHVIGQAGLIECMEQHSMQGSRLMTPGYQNKSGAATRSVLGRSDV